MRSIILIALGCLITGAASGQRFELGLNAGMSTTTQPNNSYYKGDEHVWTPAYGLSFLYNFNDRWQIGLSAGLTSWKRKSEWKITGTEGDSLSTEEVNFVLAERAVNIGVQFNHVVPFYQRYEDFVKSSLYFGVSAGALFTGNSGNVVYSRVNPNTPVEFTYVSTYHFDRGYGFSVGAQIGYNYYFGQKVGLNVEFAPKYANVQTIDSRRDKINESFDLFYFPVTAGVRIRIGE